MVNEHGSELQNNAFCDRTDHAPAIVMLETGPEYQQKCLLIDKKRMYINIVISLLSKKYYLNYLEFKRAVKVKIILFQQLIF